MSLAARSLPIQADLPASSPPSETSQSPLLSLESIAASLRALSRSWKAMNAGDDSLAWQRKWKSARASLDELQELFEP